MDFIEIYNRELILSVVLAIILLMIWNALLQIKYSKLKKRFLRFTRGGSNQNLEHVIAEYQREVTLLFETQKKNSKDIEFLLKKISEIKGNVAMVRYNAFSEPGNDLSYSIAILDDSKNGIVITSIYNREQSNTYAKPVTSGKSNYRLSEEEQKVVELALKH